MMNVYAGKRPISTLTDNYDLIINIAKVGPGTDQRVQWPLRLINVYNGH